MRYIKTERVDEAEVRIKEVKKVPVPLVAKAQIHFEECIVYVRSFIFLIASILLDNSTKGHRLASVSPKAIV